MGRVKNRYQVAKHFEWVIEDGRFEYARRTEAIAREEQLDGFYILRTSEPEKRLPTAEVVRSYKNLTNVERAFRCLKTVDLQIRPIRHRTEERVRSHLFLCLPTTWSGTCAEPWRRCCSMMRIWTRTGLNGIRCWRPNRQHRRKGRRRSGRLRTDCRCRALRR